MRILFILPLLLSGILFASAQKNSTLHIKYQMTHIRDLESRDKPFSGEYILTVDGNISRFAPFFLYRDVTSRPRTNTPVVHNAGPVRTVTGMPSVTVSNSGAMVREEIMKDRSKKKLIVNSSFVSKYFTAEEDLSPIKWTIQNEKKQILNLACTKATGEYGGRKYMAWFAEDLPIQDGPWKYTGLPGLILEVGDEQDEVHFVATDIFRNDERPVAPFLLNDNNVKISPKEYAMIKQRYEVDPEEIAKALYPGLRFNVRNIDQSDNKEVLKIKTYNPIEKK